MCQLDLTRQERRRLEKHLKTTRDVRVYRRTLALLELDEGRSVADTARMLHMSREAVYRWVAIYSAARRPSALVPVRELKVECSESVVSVCVSSGVGVGASDGSC